MVATWIGSPNFTSLTRRTVLGAVIHSSEGTMAGMNAVFNKPGGASAHYALARNDGQRFQYVREKDVAYHCFAWGSDPQFNHNRPSWLPVANRAPYSAVNACTIGIELEGYAATGFTAAQYIALADLLREISERHGVPLTLLPDAGADARIVTHGWLQTNRTDPGLLFDWGALRDALQQGDGDVAITPDEQTILDAARRQTDAGNSLKNGGDLDWWIGTWKQLATDKESLAQLLLKSQGETAAHQADAERLRAELTAALNEPLPEPLRLFPSRLAFANPTVAVYYADGTSIPMAVDIEP